MILTANPKAGLDEKRDRIDSAIRRVLDSGWLILGKEVSSFENEFASWLGLAHTLGVASGTDAIELGLRTLGIGAGDEVITVSHTAVATVVAIEKTGASAVLVDIDPKTFTIDATKIEKRITSKTKVILPVHLYGQCADLSAILAIAKKYHLKVLEDCAQAHGATYHGKKAGTFGDIASYSFYPTKNLGALGDGGAIGTSDPSLFEKAKLIREYGWKDKYISSLCGMNSRLDELQAAVLRVKLDDLTRDNARRVVLAKRYNEAFANSSMILPVESSQGEHVYHLYVVRSKKRNELQTFLKSKQIVALIHYPTPIHLQPAYLGRLAGHDELPETERASKEVLSLPMYPELKTEEQDQVIAAILEFEKNHDLLSK
jgi:dTDP-4-amino-4,6-dideoxygalactose transaminase